jgi:hypothetical protein
MSTPKTNMGKVTIVLTWMMASTAIAQQAVGTSQPYAMPQAAQQFFQKIDLIAQEAGFGAERLAKVWPASNPTITPATTTHPLTLSGGRDRLDAHTMISASMVEFSPRNPQNVSVASLSIDGICVTQQDLEQRYSDLVQLDAPRLDKPSAFTTLGAYGSWGLKRFTFQNGNRCLLKVAFQPTPVLPKAFPNDDRPDRNLKSDQ